MVTRAPLRGDVSGERLMPPVRPRVRRRALAAAVFVSAVLLAVVHSAGAGVLDQSQPGVSNVSTDISDRNQLAQTFTNGRTGALDQVDIAVGRVAPFLASLRVEIRPVSSGVPNGPALASESLPAASVPLFVVPTPFISVALVPPAPVTAGVQYAIVVSSSSCGSVDCYQQVFGPGPGDPYPAGMALFSGNAGATWAPIVHSDLPFKTYVLQPPTSKQQCKKGGWRKFRNPSFKNQGQCVKFVNHQGSKPGNAGKAKDKKTEKKGGKKK